MSVSDRGLSSDRLCQWPIGDPRDPDFRFCVAPRAPGKSSYCAHHHAIAYTPQKPYRLQVNIAPARDACGAK